MFRRRKRDPKPTSTRDPIIEAITDSNFLELTAGRPTVVDLWAPWCRPCHSFRPLFEAVAAEWQDDVRFGACDVDENGATAALLQVQSIPTVVAFSPDGNEAGRLVGVPSRARLEALVTQLAENGGRRDAG